MTSEMAVLLNMAEISN